jgi:hypothetical protein
VTVIDLTFDSKDKFKRFTCDSLYKPSPLPELEIVCGEYNSKPMPKRLKHKRKEDIILLAFNVRLPDSLDSFTKSSKNKSKRHKEYSHHKFTERYLSKYIDNKSK